MNLSLAQLKGRVDTLPVGFYCGRQIPVEVDEKQPMSSYNPKNDCIVISAQQLSQGLEYCKDMVEANSLIRSNFYHELSHAILTPKDMTPTTAVNIVEDERIERICRNTYYGVDFETAKLKTVGGEEALKIPPNSPEEAFFRLVRFGMGNKYFTDKVENILERYKHLARNEGNGEFYKKEIQELYREFTGEYDQEKEEKQYKEGEGDGNEEFSEGSSKSSRSYNPGYGEKKFYGTSTLKAIAERNINRDFNYDFHKQAEQLFENYKKKNNKGGSLSGYSGVMNPRMTGRQDCRYFERPAPIRGGNPYGTLHLNIFIDTSGSFCRNDKATNAILYSLSLIEKKNPNFSFDVVTTGSEEIILNKSERFISSHGGNHLSKKINPIYKKLQFPQTSNYNIILFDGDAYSNDCRRTSDWYNEAEIGKGFRAFANNSCTIISDEQNKPYIKKYCPNTHTIYTKNYVTELYNNVLKALQRALI